MANLTFIYGAMGAGKTISLIKDAYNYEKNHHKVLVIKPIVDTKGGSKIVTRIGLERNVDLWLDKNDRVIKQIGKKRLKEYAVIFIDEAQFLNPKQVEELWMISKDYDIPVNCYGLKNDFSSKFFKGSKRIFELADKFEELRIQCSCGKDAKFNARKVNNKFVSKGSSVVIDGEDDNIEYVPLCPKCYRKNVLNK